MANMKINMASFVTCKAKSLTAMHAWVQKLNVLIHEYRWIIDAYVSDFYTSNHWHRLPHSVQDYFDAVEPPDLAWMLAVGKSVEQKLSKSVIPLSLLSLHCCVQSLSLKRVAVNLDSPEARSSISLSLSTRVASMFRDVKSTLTAGGLVDTDANHKSNYKNGQCMDMQHIFRKHVKPKKQHEIDKLGQVVSLLSQLSSCSNVVDVGAGLGHLSRLLTFQHNLKVTTVEAVDGHAPVAAAYDRELKRDLHKASEKRQVASVETVCSNKSVNNSKDISATNKHALQKEALSNESTRDYKCDSIGSSIHTDTHCHAKSPLCLNNIDYSSSSTRPALKCNEYESSCDLHSLNHSREQENCHAKSGVCSPPCCEMSDGEDSLPNHVICRVQPDIASSQFLDIINQRTQRDTGREDEMSSNFILVGLHACGDLTPTLLRVFVNCKTAVGLASVACCYMKISSSKPNRSTLEATDFDNYPMSKYVKDLPCCQLSYGARELACHFADAYSKRLKDNSPYLKVHAFRAALQCLITFINPEFKSGSVRLVTKKEARSSFQQYMSDSLKKVNIDQSAVPQDVIEHCENLTKLWKRVVAFYTLRLCLAPAVETLILLDRALFLLENGLELFKSSSSQPNNAKSSSSQSNNAKSSSS